MPERDRYWLGSVVLPLVGYWLGWALLMPSDGIALWTLPAYKQAYVLGVLPVIGWSLANAFEVWSAIEIGNWPLPDASQS